MTEPLRTALLTRAFTLPIDSEAREPARPKSPNDRPSRIDGRVLVFDTETNDDVSQSLLVATFALFDDRHLEELGVVWADDLPAADRLTIDVWAEKMGYRCVGQRAFVFDYISQVARADGLICNFNLPFDHAVIMTGWDYASKRGGGRFGGGFRLGYRHEHSCQKTIGKYLERPFGSFSRSCVGKFKKMNQTLSATQVYAKIAADPDALWCDDCRKRDGVPFQRLATPIDIKRLDAKKAFVRYGARGAGLDLKTFYHALFDESVSLEHAARNLHTEHQKTRIETYGVVTPESLAYCMNDTLVTCDVLWKLVAELERHPIDLEPEHAYSPASIAKAYMRAMGIDKPAPLDTSALQ